MNKQYYQDYYHFERNHWWFRARLYILEKIFPATHLVKSHILNAGVATGATSEMLSKFGDVTSLEYDKDCCRFLKETVNIVADNASLTDLPYKNNSFDSVCAFDVIEHIDDDQKALSEIHRVLKKNQKMMLTVPAFPILWSEHDEINHHFRRYKINDLTEKVKSAGFTIDFKSYFNFWLFLPILLVRLFSKINICKKKHSKDLKSDFERYQTGFIDKILFRIFKSEAFFLSKGWSFPFGVTIILIASKK
jgi:SAM-dependent methyltransferase